MKGDLSTGGLLREKNEAREFEDVEDMEETECITSVF